MGAFLVITFQGAPVTNHAGPSKQLNFISVQLKLIIIICITKIVSREPNVLSCYLIVPRSHLYLQIVIAAGPYV